MAAFEPMPVVDIMRDSKHHFPKPDDKLVVYVSERRGYKYCELDMQSSEELAMPFEDGTLPYTRHILEHLNPNGHVVPYVDIVTALLACNTAMIYNGNEESAENSMEYQTKICDTVEITFHYYFFYPW